MLSQDEIDILNRIASALERLANRYAPEKPKEHGPATLGTASYSEEERERIKLRDALKSKTQKQA